MELPTSLDLHSKNSPLIHLKVCDIIYGNETLDAPALYSQKAIPNHVLVMDSSAQGRLNSTSNVLDLDGQSIIDDRVDVHSIMYGLRALLFGIEEVDSARVVNGLATDLNRLSE
jgi:hypothetical protein